MRLFIALDLEELKHYFKELQEQIPNDIARLKQVSRFHLTLKFLGETDKEHLEKIKTALKEVKFNPLKLKLTEKLGVFPSNAYIKVIWVGLEENKPLLNLQEDIQKALHKFHKREDFKFLPHLTLARVKFINNKPEFLEKLKQIKVEPKEIEIKEFKLIKSELTGDGPIYTDLEVFPQSL